MSKPCIDRWISGVYPLSDEQFAYFQEEFGLGIGGEYGYVSWKANLDTGEIEAYAIFENEYGSDERDALALHANCKSAFLDEFYRIVSALFAINIGEER